MGPFSGGVSGILVLLIGIWLLLHRARVDSKSGLGWFLVAWGLGIVLSNLAAVLPRAGLALAREASALALPLLVTSLVATQVTDTKIWRNAVVPVFAGVAVMGAFAIAVRPDLFIAPSSNGASLVAGSGPLALVFGQLAFYAALGASTLLLLSAAQRATERARSRELVLVSAAFLCFLGSATAWFGARSLVALPQYAATRSALEAVIVATLFATSGTFLALAAWRAARGDMPRDDRRLVAAALVLPFATSLAAALVLLAGGPRVNPVGFWRTMTVALLVLAVLRHRLIDGELRFRRTATVTLTAFFALGVALLAEGLARSFGASALTDAPAALVVGAVFACGVVVPYLPVSRRAARRAFRALVEPHDPSRAQDLEMYRAALEARGPDHPDVVRLRQDLHIEPREHDLMMLFLDRRRAPPPRFDPGARILDGTLTVEREIGAGASARVYEARDEAGRAVAVKVQAPLLQGEGAAGARAVREARILDGLRSQHVVPVVEVADRPEAFYVVTERARGTLAGRLSAGPLAQDEALRIARDVLKGLAAAHGAGVVHCDVKPSNVLLAADGRAMLADFDASRAAGEVGTRGTPAWMAPEQFAGRVDARVDVHAVGALLFRMLAGRHYVRVDGLDEREMRLLIERAEAAIPTEWAPEVRTFVARCLAKDPEARYRDAADALGALPASDGGQRQGPGQ